MIITLDSPRKGLGQTSVGILISAYLSEVLGKRTILIDLNKRFNDVNYYLSDAKITKGLDDFYLFCSTGLYSDDKFDSCIKTVSENLHIMSSSNKSLDVSEDLLAILLSSIEKRYDYCIFDSISNAGYATDLFSQQSDRNLVLLNQSSLVVNSVLNWDESNINEFNKKGLFVLNKYNKNIDLNLNSIKKKLSSKGFKDKIYKIDYCSQIVDEMNNYSMLNILNSESSGVIDDLVPLIHELIGIEIEQPGKKKNKSIKSFIEKLAMME